MEKRASGGKKSDGSYGYRPSSGYGYGYGGSPYGYGAYGYGSVGGGGASVVERTLQDYLLILRERFWYIVFAFVIVSTGAAVYTFTRLPLYQSEATVEIFRRAPTVMQGMQQVLDSQVTSVEDLNTQINILKSEAIIQGVAERLKGNDLEQFLKPYRRSGSTPPSAIYLLSRNRDVVPERLSLIIDINYRHPNPQIAALVANLFADAYIAYHANIRVDESMKAIEELTGRANDQRKKVNAIAAEIQAFREKNNLVSLDHDKDIVTETLKELNTLVTQTSATLQSAEIRWTQVQEARKSGRSLLDLPFIVSAPAVAQLQSQVALQKISIAQLGERYRKKHPMMVQAQRSLEEAQRELQKAIETSAAQIEAEFQTALRNYAKAEAARSAQVSNSLSMDRYGLEFSALQRDYDVNEKILEQILDVERTRQTAANTSLENENARIVDHATPTTRAFYPNYSLNLALGLFGGLAIGLALALTVAYLDDRIKSAFDIESVVGLPILGIIPEVKRLGTPEKMIAGVEAQPQRELVEAFSTLMSALQLKEESKNAQCILITSTIAGEGKSFIASNLAQTYAAHGEKVILIDADLRRPAVNRVFHLENLKGVIDVCSGAATISEVIVKGVRPNLDIIVTGGRAKNPTQTLNSREFAQMLSDLKKQYTKIFVDTPPIAIVSDAFIVLPLMDGSIYSIYFNKVRRKLAETSARRLLETNVPNYGAVLNGLTGGIGGYYYAHYYDRSYKDYYVKRAEVAHGEGVKIDENAPNRKKR